MKPFMGQEKPPYARFEVRAVEDREATLERGYYTTKDVIFALITPSGSRDVVIKVAEEWFEQMEQFVREERFNPMWLEYYRGLFESFKKGIEPELEGTDIRNWPFLSPSQVNLLRELGIRTVEALADLNEEGLRRLGMGGRDLKTRAQQYVAQNDDRVNALQEANKAMAEQLQAMQEKLSELQAASKSSAEEGKVPTPQEVAAKAAVAAATAAKK